MGMRVRSGQGWPLSSHTGPMHDVEISKHACRCSRRAAVQVSTYCAEFSLFVSGTSQCTSSSSYVLRCMPGARHGNGGSILSQNQATTTNVQRPAWLHTRSSLDGGRRGRLRRSRAMLLSRSRERAQGPLSRLGHNSLQGI